MATNPLADLEVTDGFVPDDDGFTPDVGTDDGFVPDVSNDGQQLAIQAEPAMSVKIPDAIPQAAPAAPQMDPKLERLSKLDDTSGPAWGFDPLSAGLTALGEFEKTAIDPVIKWVQKKERDRYEKRIAPTLREKAPQVAFAVENLGKLAYGETELNRGPESKQGPSDKQSAIISDLQEKFGDKGAAAYQSMLQGFSNLPLYLIPGLGEEAVVQGATAGLLSGLADPSVGVEESTIGGGSVGGAVGGLVKLGTKAAGALKGLTKKAAKAEALPIGVIAPSQVDAFADTVMKMPETAIPTKDVPEDAVALVISKEGDDLVAKALKIEDGVPTVQRIQEGTAKASPRALVADATPKSGPNGTVASPRRQNVIVTPEARDMLKAEASADGPTVDDWVAGKWLDGDTVFTKENAPDLGPLNDVHEGKVLVLEGGGGDGTARLYDINSPKLQMEVLRQRGLHEVKLPDGSKVLAFPIPSPTDSDNFVTLMRPEADEFLPNALKQDMSMSQEEFYRSARSIESDNDLRRILGERQQLIQDAEDTAERVRASAVAQQLDVQLGGTGDGGKLPPAPPVDGGAPIGPPNPNSLSASDEPKARWWQNILKAGRAIDRKFLPPTARGPLDIADEAVRAFSVDNLERYRADTLKSLNQQFPELGQMKPLEQKAVLSSITKYLVGDIDRVALEQKYPQVKAAVWQRIESEKAQIAVDERRLRELGMLGPEDTIAKAMGVKPEDMEDYAVRMYWRHLMSPGEWATMFKKDERVMKSVTDDIYRDVYSTKEFKLMSEEQRRTLAETHLDFLLGDPEKMKLLREDPEGAFKNILSEARGSLKARKDLRSWEKLALGEVDNAFVRIAETRARQKQLILQGEIWQNVANNPRLSTHGDARTPEQIREWRQIPTDQARFGKAAGKYVDPEVWESLVTLPKMQRNQSAGLARWINALKYTRTVGNAGSWVTNFMANGQSMLLSNLVNPFASPYSAGKGMLQFGRDLQSHLAAPGLPGEVGRSRFERAMELGIIGSDYSTAEFRSSASEWRRMLEKEASKGRGIDVMELFPRMLKQGKGAKDWLAQKYGAIDPLWKYSTYVNGLEKGGFDLKTGKIDQKRAIKFLMGSETGFAARTMAGFGQRINPLALTGPNVEAYLKDAVEKEVARRIHLSFPMLDRVAPVTAKMTQLAGITNPFGKIKYEMLRVYSQLPKRIVEEPGMAGTAMSLVALAGGSVLAMQQLRQAMGVDKQQVDAAFASAPAGIQRFKPGAMALWYRPEDGSTQFADLTQLFEPLTYLSGDPNSKEYTRVLQNLAMSPVDGSLVEPEIAELLANGGLLPDQFRSQNLPAWQKGGAQMMGDLTARFAPATIPNMYKTMERGQVGFTPKGVKGPEVPAQPLSNTVANLALGPNRFFTAGSVEEKTRAIQAAAGEVTRREKELNDLGVKNDGQSMGNMTMPLNKQAAMKRAREELDAAVRRLKELEAKFGRTK